MMNNIMENRYHSHLSGLSAIFPFVLLGKRFDIGQYSQSIQPFFFIPAMLRSIVDRYHILPLSTDLSLADGQSRSG